VRDKPTLLPVPERMTVSLADEVSLESTAPNPAEASAAVAPEIAPIPVPPPPAEPIAKVTPREEPRPAPRPTQTRAAGSRLGDEFLQGAGASERSDARGTPAAAFGAAEQASLAQAINRQLKPHWNAPQGVDAEQLVTVLTWELNSDGSLKGSPRVVSQSGITDSNRPQAALHAERAIRAVQLAAPFDDLPPQFYDKWKRIRTWRFDRRL
jgi:hypothetical protein